MTMAMLMMIAMMRKTTELQSNGGRDVGRCRGRGQASIQTAKFLSSRQARDDRENLEEDLVNNKVSSDVIAAACCIA